MPALVHTTFRVSNAKQFKESFEEKKENGIGGYIPAFLYTANSTTFEPELTSSVALADATSIPTYALDDQIFLFIGRVSRWTQFDDPAYEVDGTINANLNENNPPFPVDSMKDAHFNHWDDMIAAKRVADTEVSHVIKRERADEIKSGVRNWKTGLRYDEYDSRDDTMFDDDMLIHTLNNKFRVYKCIKKGVGRFTRIESPIANTITADYKTTGNTAYMWNYQSSREPLERDISCDPPNGKWTEDFMRTGTTQADEFNDGYQWKYYYTIDAGQALKFVTTSYIPTKRLRKENGSIVDDSSDQYVVENASIPGAILNVVTLKKEPNGFDTSGVRYGYDTRGGDGYFQLAATDVVVNYDADQPAPGGKILQFQIDTTKLRDCHWPNANVAIDYAGFDGTIPEAHNRFDFTGGTAQQWLQGGNTLVGYGVVITDGNGHATFDDEAFKRYVFPIDGNGFAAGTLTVDIDQTFLDDLVNDSTYLPAPQASKARESRDGIIGLPFSTAISSLVADGIKVEIHPIVKIDTNFQATTVNDRVDAFHAFAVVEPLVDLTTDPAKPRYHATLPGRIIDTRVVNPGRYHYRVDKTYVTPDVTDTTYTNTYGIPTGSEPAVLWACIPPVGGHGWDPVEELGGFNVMINARFEGDEADEFTVKNEFRKIGILKNPLRYTAAQGTTYLSANAQSGFPAHLNQLWMSDAVANPNAYTELFREYKTDQCYRVHLDGSGTFGLQGNYANALFYEPDMDVRFEATGTFTSIGSQRTYNAGQVIAHARIVDHDPILNRIRVIKPRMDWGTILEGGDFVVNSVSLHSVTFENIVGNTLNDSPANTATEPHMKPGSGKILYIENRSMVSRSPNQTEDLKISIQF
jgi:hypothetical protein